MISSLGPGTPAIVEESGSGGSLLIEAGPTLARSRWTWVGLLMAAVLFTAATCNKGTQPLPQGAKPDAGSAPPPAPAASLPSIQGMDFSSLSAPARRELATVLNDEFCYCGCPHTLGGCLQAHTSCKHARRMTQLAAAEAAEGVAAVEIIVHLSKYYASFNAPRAQLKVDDRMCMGNKAAKVTLVEFSDFECPFC